MKKNKRQEIFSEAFPPDNNGGRKKLLSLSNSHNLLKDIKINKEAIIYKPISKVYINEVKKLHKEWFPVEYDDDYFQKIFENKHGVYFTIGAFYNYDKREIILGLALCEYRPITEYFVKHTSPKAIEEICQNINFQEEVISYLRCEDYNCAYIMTIGVLDECRKLGIGTNLINYINNKALSDKICIGTYLDVIYYNKSAIKFYEKNGFKKVTTLKNYYDLKGVYYDCEVFLKVFTRKEKDNFRDKHSSSLQKILNKLFFPFSAFLKVIIFFLFFQCFRGKIKKE